MKLNVGQIAQLLNAEVEGNPELEIHGLAKIEEAGPGEITFLANPRYERYVSTTGASAIIVSSDFKLLQPVEASLIRCANPYSAFTMLLGKAAEMVQVRTGIEQPSFIHETASIGEDVYIGAFAYIGAGVKIGDRARIYPNVTLGDQVSIGENSIVYANVSIYHGCQIGSHCVVHSGAVIGSDGFGFAPQKDGSFVKIPQMGIVHLEDYVEVGAGTTIDRSTLGKTVICKGVKLDNLIQVAHNVEIGSHTVIAAQTGISGSSKLGKNCMIGGQVGISGHLNLADGTQIGAQSGVSKSITEKGKVLRGSPAQDYKRQLRSEAVFRNLDALAKKVHKLEKRLLKRDQE